MSAEIVRYSVLNNAFFKFIKISVRIFLYIVFRMGITGRKNELKSGRVIYAANHISAWDPPVVGSAVSRDLSFLAKKELFEIPGVGMLISTLHSHPVDRAGYSRGVLDKLKMLLESEQGILIFPEGTRSRDGKLQEGKIGVGMLSVWTGAPVVPVYVSGTNVPIKSLFFLRRFRVDMGDPIIPPAVESAADRKRAYQEVTDQVMAQIAEMKARIDS